MEDREAKDGVEDGSAKETSKDGAPSRPRSDEEEGSSPSGGRTSSSRHRDRRKSRTSRKGRKRSSSKRRSGNKRKRTNQQLLGVSSSITKRASRRPTRASIHHQDNCQTGNETPAIPRRVFKALQLLRHEKFLRVVSKYLKPSFQRHE